MATAKLADSADVAVFYLARGADEAFDEKIRRFRDSYLENPAGLKHDLFVIYKGYRNAEHLAQAQRALHGLAHGVMMFPDDGLDLGAYFRAASRVTHGHVAFFNTSSAINAHNWLLKLWRNIKLPDAGMVGATGSFEGQVEGPLQFPNAHVRSNAFMMEREAFMASRKGNPLQSKADAYALEHGADSITAQCLKARKTPLIVGKDGRGFPPHLWSVSQTFRQGRQDNLLVRDGQTDAFDNAPHWYKRQLYNLAWGEEELLEGYSLWDTQPKSTRKKRVAK